MEPIEQLKIVLKDTLDQRGVLGQLKDRLRKETYTILNQMSTGDVRPYPSSLSNENLLVNELIREYLEFNQYRYSASVLKCESGQEETRLDREFLRTELNMPEDNDTVPMPLLYSVVAYFSQKAALKATDSSASDSDPASARSITIHQVQEENDQSPRSPVSPRSPRQNSN